jgi:predicted lipoprotein with Yx(FWY)xxD motif
MSPQLSGRLQRHPTSHRLRAALVLALITPLLVACGSASSGASSSGSSSIGSATTQSSGSGQSAAAANATVTTAKVAGYGEALADAKGAALFLFTGKAACTGSCAQQWTPLTVTGAPTAGSGVEASLLSTVKRDDGSQQVTYDGHALYTHPGMAAASVAGTASGGGIWYLVATTGKAITKTNGNGY